MVVQISETAVEVMKMQILTISRKLGLPGRDLNLEQKIPHPHPPKKIN